MRISLAPADGHRVYPPAVLKDYVFTSESVNEGGGLFKEQGAGDQGMMFGYACDETREYMPFAIYTAHRIGQRLGEARRSGLLPFLRPDGKCQVTVEYRGGRALRDDTVVVSTQHTPDVAYGTL